MSSWLYFSCQQMQPLICEMWSYYCLLIELQCFKVSIYFGGKGSNQQFRRGRSHLTDLDLPGAQVQQRETSVT